MRAHIVRRAVALLALSLAASSGLSACSDGKTPGETGLPSTDDTGAFRVWGLAPGDYIVEASATDQASQQPQRQKAHIEGSGQSRLDFYWR